MKLSAMRDRLLPIARAGVRPADLPIEQATEYSLVVNLKAADALRIRVPQGVLLRADEVIR